jgi:hypothetical protein
VKIKDWLRNIEALGDEDTIIGDVRFHNGIAHFDLVLSTDEVSCLLYDATPTEGS